VILCVGETLEEREADKTAAVVESQLAEVIKILDKDPAKWE
jgi:triosephosphate isomerase (TIM)